jgi:hypothetical protein
MATIKATQLVHIAHGILAGVVFRPLPLLSFFLYIQFLAYEYFEETKIRDEMYFELREWALGFFIGLIAYYIAYFTGFLPILFRPAV